MVCISTWKDNKWQYFSEPFKNFPDGDQYGWSPSISMAKTFESIDEAKLFWKVLGDKKQIPELGEKTAIRKIIFKTEVMLV